MKKLSILLIVFMAMGFAFSVNAQEAKIDKKSRPALLIIDVQKVYFDKMDQSAVEIPIERINDATHVFNEHQYPVIYVYHISKTSEKYQYIDEITVPEDATKVVKNYGNAFINTELDSLLKELDCNTLFLCGLSATGCVKDTYLGAKELGYNTFLIKDANMSPDKEKTKKIEDKFKAMNLESVTSLLPKLK